MGEEFRPAGSKLTTISHVRLLLYGVFQEKPSSWAQEGKDLLARIDNLIHSNVLCRLLMSPRAAGELLGPWNLGGKYESCANQQKNPDKCVFPVSILLDFARIRRIVH